MTPIKNTPDVRTGSSTATTVAAPKQLPPGATLHRMEGGESLWTVWSHNKTGVTWEAFKAANSHLTSAPGRDDGNHLWVGDPVVVPKGKQAEAAPTVVPWKAAGAADPVTKQVSVAAPAPEPVDPAKAKAFRQAWQQKAEVLRAEATAVTKLPFGERPGAIDALIKKTSSFSNDMRADAQNQFTGSAPTVLDGEKGLQLGALRRDLIARGTADGGISWKDAAKSLMEAGTAEAVDKTLAGWIDKVKTLQDGMYESRDAGLKGVAQGAAIGVLGGLAKLGLGAGKMLNAAPEFITQTLPGMAGVIADKGVLGVLKDLPAGFEQEGVIIGDIAQRVGQTYEKGGIGAVVGETAVIAGTALSALGNMANALRGAARVATEVADTAAPATRTASAVVQTVGVVEAGVTKAPHAATAVAAPVLTPIASAAKQVVSEGNTAATAAPVAAPAAAATGAQSVATKVANVGVGPGEHINNVAKRMVAEAEKTQGEVRAQWGDTTLVARQGTTAKQILSQRPDSAVMKAPAVTTPAAPVLTPVAGAARDALAPGKPALTAAVSTKPATFSGVKVGTGEHIGNVAKRMIEQAKSTGAEVRAQWGDRMLVATPESSKDSILAQRGAMPADKAAKAAGAPTPEVYEATLRALAKEKASFGDLRPPTVSVPASEKLEAINEQIAALPKQDQERFGQLVADARATSGR